LWGGIKGGGCAERENPHPKFASGFALANFDLPTRGRLKARIKIPLVLKRARRRVSKDEG
jgi:hypothetical protein